MNEEIVKTRLKRRKVKRMVNEGLASKVSGMDKTADIAKFIGVLMMSRTYAHLAHLKTGSYAAHKALNDLYDGLVDLLDSFAEAAQGEFGKLDIPYINIMGSVDAPSKAVASHLKTLEKLGEGCSQGYLKNIVDEVGALYRSTLYKLNELK